MSAKPVWKHIRDELREGIDQGRYPIGSRLPTEVELCVSYGVSRPSAARALKALESEGYLTRRPGRGGRSTVTGSGPKAKGLIALAMANSGHFFGILQQHLMTNIEAIGHSLALFGNEPLTRDEGWARMVGIGSEAAVIQSCNDFVPFMDRWWRQLPFPVFYGTWPRRSYQGSYVVPDPLPGSLTAIAVSKRQGFARVMFYEHELSLVLDPTVIAFEQALATQVDDLVVHRIWTSERAEATVVNEASAVLAKAGPGTAVLCGSDFLAVTVFKAARQLGWQLGREYALIGRFDTPWSEMYGFSSVSLDEPALASAVAELIRRRVPGRIVVPSRLIERRPTPALALPP